MIVWADEIGTGQQPLGVAQTYLDDRAGDVNVNNYGGRDALIIGRGKTYFFDDAPASSWEPASVALHELTHTLGAVQNGAPHSSKAGHCTDEWDIMCYADGSPTNPLNGSGLTLACAGSPSAEVYDCGGDDYFNVSPTPGSWLAGHWNVAFSPFLCAASSCFATLHPPTVSPSPASAAPDLYEPVTIDASAVTDDGPRAAGRLGRAGGARGLDVSRRARAHRHLGPPGRAERRHLRHRQRREPRARDRARDRHEPAAVRPDHRAGAPQRPAARCC